MGPRQHAPYESDFRLLTDTMSEVLLRGLSPEYSVIRSYDLKFRWLQEEGLNLCSRMGTEAMHSFLD